MERYRVIDYDEGCGGLTVGLEDSGFFEVIEAPFLNENNEKVYNNSHINDFGIHYANLTRVSYDLCVYHLFLGDRLSKKGVNNFSLEKLDLMFDILKDVKSNNFIIYSSVDTIPYLQDFTEEVYYLADNIPTVDIVSSYFIKNGFDVYNFVVDGIDFGIPQHVYYNVYWATKDIDGSILPEPFCDGFDVPYRTPGEFLSYLKDDTEFNMHNVDYTKRSVCEKISPGHSASDTKGVSQRRGYLRIDKDKPIDKMDLRFYLVSSDFACIHPWYDRPLTIREGALLFGLDGRFVFGDDVLKKDVVSMIYNVVPPIIGQEFGKKIVALLKKDG